MKHANQVYIEAQKIREDSFLALNEELLKALETKIGAAADLGEMELTNVFISHREKFNVIGYLTKHGYHCTENTIGNTFTISWNPNNKK